MPHYPLLFITKAPETVRCKGTGGGEANYPPRDPQVHSQRISRLFEEAWASSNRASTQRVCVALPAKKGVYLEVKGAAGHDLATQSLDSRRDGYTLLNVRQVDEENSITSIATIFIPEESKLKFVEKIRKYAEEKTPRGNYYSVFSRLYFRTFYGILFKGADNTSSRSGPLPTHAELRLPFGRRGCLYAYPVGSGRIQYFERRNNPAVYVRLSAPGICSSGQLPTWQYRRAP